MTFNLKLEALWILVAATVLGVSGPIIAPAAATDDAPAAAAPAAAAPTFKAEEIDALVAPIALYPDPLLAQIFMASTYPLEVVEAARWQKEHADLKDKALEDALLAQKWDPSVKSLVAFPQVLTMMNEKLDWTQKLGDAFLAQQDDVMLGVQRLRNKAQEAGTLQTTKEQKVIVEEKPVAVSQTVNVEQQPPPPPQTIVIQPADPQVVYVPQYNPTTAYGTWPYPASPPYSYYPPGYVAATSMMSFGVGMMAGAALWGDCDWDDCCGGGGDNVKINVNNYNNFNKTDIKNGNWNHNAEHRKGVGYRDKGSQQKYGQRGQQARNTASRDAFRGRADSGRQQMARSGTGQGAQAKQMGGAQNRQGGRDAAGQRQPQAKQQGRSQQQAKRQPQQGQRRDAGASAGTRQAGGSRGNDAFRGMNNGNAARQQSARGSSSRQSSFGGSGGGSRGGGSRGGGSRGGGGRGGGGRR